MKYYHKIETLYNRDIDGTKKLIIGSYRDNTIEALKDIQWVCTEKIDGTNVSIHWDGHKVSFHGRTERSDMPKPLLGKLEELFGGSDNEQIFEQLFGENEVILYGEGYGGKIQKGHGYKDTQDFIMFDVYFPGSDLYLRTLDSANIAEAFNVRHVPVMMVGTLDEAVDFVRSSPMSIIGTKVIEGVVARPVCELKDNRGKRVIVKIKVTDFEK